MVESVLELRARQGPAFDAYLEGVLRYAQGGPAGGPRQQTDAAEE